MSLLRDRIAEAMRRHPHLTQANIARACKVKTPSVAGWLNGRTKSLAPDPARRAAELFGCDQNWIGQGVGVPNWRTSNPYESPPIELRAKHIAREPEPVSLEEALRVLCRALATPMPDRQRAELADVFGLLVKYAGEDVYCKRIAALITGLSGKPQPQAA